MFTIAELEVEFFLVGRGGRIGKMIDNEELVGEGMDAL